MHAIDHINLPANDYKAIDPEIKLPQAVPPVSDLPVEFELSEDGNILYVHNATRIIKILNATGKVTLIQTAAKNNKPIVFDIKKLKKGKYFILAGMTQYTFIKK